MTNLKPGSEHRLSLYLKHYSEGKLTAFEAYGYISSCFYTRHGVE